MEMTTIAQIMIQTHPGTIIKSDHIGIDIALIPIAERLIEVINKKFSVNSNVWLHNGNYIGVALFSRIRMNH